MGSDIHPLVDRWSNRPPPDPWRMLSTAQRRVKELESEKAQFERIRDTYARDNHELIALVQSIHGLLVEANMPVFAGVVGAGLERITGEPTQ